MVEGTFSDVGVMAIPMLGHANFSVTLHIEGGSGVISGGVPFDQITVLTNNFGITALSKQCRPRSDAAERGV